MERNTRTKAEREYVKGIIQNLSLKRITDQEIVDYLHDEKHIEIARSTVTNTRNAIEKQAEKWYIELRNSAYKYLAQYKQRIDSLLSYQKTLHEIISNTNKDEVKIRAISELHSIEMDILSLWKQLPASNIVNTVDNTENEKKVPWAVQLQIGGGQEQIGEKEESENEKEPEVWTIDPILNSSSEKFEVEIQEHDHRQTSTNLATDDDNNDTEPEQEQDRPLPKAIVTELERIPSPHTETETVSEPLTEITITEAAIQRENPDLFISEPVSDCPR